MIPDYLRPMPEIPPFFFPLDIDQQNAIEMNFAASKCPNIETSAPVPDSPATSLQSAADYLVKLNQKGYAVLQGMPPEQIRRTFNRSLKPVIIHRTKKKEKSSNAAELSERYKDPELKFFLTSNVVKKLKKKISELPFTTDDDLQVTLAKLEEKIVELAHRMIHMRMFDYRKMSRYQLQQSTSHFVFESQKVGDEIIRSAFKEKIIDLTKCTPEQKEDYKEFFPVPKPDVLPRRIPMIPAGTAKPDEVLYRLFETGKRDHVLPKDYRPNVNDLRESGRPSTAVQVKKRLTNIAQSLDHVLTRPSTAPVKVSEAIVPPPQTKTARKPPEIITSNISRKPKPQNQQSIVSARKPQPLQSARKTQSIESARKFQEISPTSSIMTTTTIKKTSRSIHINKTNKQQTTEKADKLLWEVGDPLLKQREGQFVDQLATIKSLSNEIDMTNMIIISDEHYQPFTFESKLTAPPTPIIISRDVSESDLTLFTGTDGPEVVIDSVSKRKRVVRTEPLKGNYDTSKDKSKLVTFLVEHEDDFDGDITQSPIYSRLGKIWEDLGFTITQKLEMVLKYSKDLEESSRLTEALESWEHAYANIRNYQVTYRNLKMFLSKEVFLIPPAKRHMLYTQLADDMRISITGVMHSANYLKNTYNDDLLMKRKKINDLIYSRDIKLQLLFSQADIVADSDQF